MCSVYLYKQGREVDFPINVIQLVTQWRIQDFEKGGSTPTQMHSQALPARNLKHYDDV